MILYCCRKLAILYLAPIQDAPDRHDGQTDKGPIPQFSGCSKSDLLLAPIFVIGQQRVGIGQVAFEVDDTSVRIHLFHLGVVDLGVILGAAGAGEEPCAKADQTNEQDSNDAYYDFQFFLHVV